MSEKRDKIRWLAPFGARAAAMSEAAKFMLSHLLNGTWTWAGLATDSTAEVSAIKDTAVEILGYLEWVWNHVDLTAEPSMELAAVMADLRDNIAAIDKALGTGETSKLGPI